MGFHQSKIISPSEISELTLAIESSKNSRTTRRLQAVLFRAKNYSKNDIATLLGFSSPHVQRIWTQYFQGGIKALLGKNHGGRRRFCLGHTEEIELLKQHEQLAKDGRILVIDALHKDLCRAAGKNVALSTAYRMAKRHGWRKIAPRPSHPKSDKKASYFFKAFFPSLSGGSQKRSRQTISSIDGDVSG